MNAAAFDAQLNEITSADVVDLAKLDQFLSTWWRIAVRANRDPEDWQRIHQIAEELESGRRQLGPTMEEILARRGVQL